MLMLLAVACGGHDKPAAIKLSSSTSSTSTTRDSTTTTVRKRPDKPDPVVRKAHPRKAAVAVHHDPPVCPLTGLQPPGGRVPRRAALAVKVENLPQARPQWGLDKADIVFEEPVEGGITRFVAVFQCQDADRIEPVRSARLVDPKILEPLGRMLIAYSGAIQPAISEIDSRRSLLSDVSDNMAPGAYWRDPDREAPHNLVTSTSALYGAGAALRYPEKPPTPIFSYGPPVLGGHPAAVLNLDFPLDVTTWTWHKDTGLYYRSYSDTGPALMGDGARYRRPTSSSCSLWSARRPTSKTIRAPTRMTWLSRGPARRSSSGTAPCSTATGSGRCSTIPRSSSILAAAPPSPSPLGTPGKSSCRTARTSPSHPDRPVGFDSLTR